MSENGGLREAYALLLKEDFPCWIYQVKAGATTIWEQWDGLLFSPGEQGFTAESGSGSYCVQYRLKTSDFLAQISKAW